MSHADTARVIEAELEGYLKEVLTLAHAYSSVPQALERQMEVYAIERPKDLDTETLMSYVEQGFNYPLVLVQPNMDTAKFVLICMLSERFEQALPKERTPRNYAFLEAFIVEFVANLKKDLTFWFTLHPCALVS